MPVVFSDQQREVNEVAIAQRQELGIVLDDDMAKDDSCSARQVVTDEVHIVSHRQVDHADHARRYLKNDPTLSLPPLRFQDSSYALVGDTRMSVL